MVGNRVFITGGTGYLGRRLVSALLARGVAVCALVRPGSEHKLPRGCLAVSGNALDSASYAASVHKTDIFVHLVGVAHPSPAKAPQFVEVDLASVAAALQAARLAGVTHFVYVSVAQPAPVMKAYVAAREQAELLIRASGLHATCLRPFYVLGPGHYWPILLLPIYWLLQLLPTTRPGAARLGLVTLRQMIDALLHAIDSEPAGVRVVGVPEIRRAGAESHCANKS